MNAGEMVQEREGSTGRVCDKAARGPASMGSIRRASLVIL